MVFRSISRPAPISTVLTRGFSLIELVVVIGVMTLILAVMLANNGRFGGAISLRALTYDVALSIRQAQTYGLAVRQFSSSFQSGYGVHFDDVSPTSYVIFGDSNGNGLYDAGELVQQNQLNNGFRIAELCSAAGMGSPMLRALPSLDILFKRPEPDAIIRAKIGNTPTLQAQARIILKSPRSDLMSVTVDTTGQISVSSNVCS